MGTCRKTFGALVVALGDRITLGKEEIVDWMFLDGEEMQGNYTLRVMLPGMDPGEAEIYRQMLAPLPE